MNCVSVALPLSFVPNNDDVNNGVTDHDVKLDCLYLVPLNFWNSFFAASITTIPRSDEMSTTFLIFFSRSRCHPRNPDGHPEKYDQGKDAAKEQTNVLHKLHCITV